VQYSIFDENEKPIKNQNTKKKRFLDLSKSAEIFNRSRASKSPKFRFSAFAPSSQRDFSVNRKFERFWRRSEPFTACEKHPTKRGHGF